MNPLEAYVRAWRESATSINALLPTLDEADWSMSTDCPGWTVKDVAAHLAHLENALATGEAGTDDPPLAVMSSVYTEAGVQARSSRTTAELCAEFADAVSARELSLQTLPVDPQSLAPAAPGGINWSWDTLLRNRAIDMWVHEQDIRRAVGKPGGLDSLGAHVTTTTFKMAMPFVIGKRVRPPAGSTVGWHVTGEIPFDLVVAVDEDGRAKAVESIDGEPQSLLSMSSESFAVLGAGRRTAAQLDVQIAGDRELATTVLSSMAVTF